MTFGAVFQRPFPPVFDRGLDAAAAAARLWVDYDTLRRRLAAGYNSAAALVDAGLAAGALPAWADVVAVIEAA